jgi:DNA-binding response OmpR family regulator
MGVRVKAVDTLRRRAWLVDEDDAFRGAIAEELRKAGFEVVEIADGETALEAIGALSDGDVAPPEIVMLDVCPATPFGLSALSAIGRMSAPPRRVAMIRSGETSLRRAACELGANAILEKPFEAGSILQGVLR